ncbi:MAG: copper uptake system-associated protein [Hyphomicrobiaceae bacterium]|nr:copper uptake system-associated protein [Hyphomicrobiaceae bacterium]
MPGLCLLRSAVMAAALVAGCAAAKADDTTADKAAIKQLARATWERADAPLGMEPIVVVGDYAIAGWVQGGQGGRALLRKRDGTWEVTLCSGDQLRSATTAIAAGVPAEVAARLEQRLREAESRLTSEYLAKLALFDGILRMDAPAAGHGDPHKHKHKH